MGCLWRIKMQASDAQPMQQGLIQWLWTGMVTSQLTLPGQDTNKAKSQRIACACILQQSQSHA